MPTGFTCDVQNGKITELGDFVLRCARAFGALITMRDDRIDTPIPFRFDPDSYYVKSVEEKRRELDRLSKAAKVTLEREWESDFKQEMDRFQESSERRALEKQRYESMLAKVKGWEPPTPDYDGLKKFMQEQLEESIKFDCSWEMPIPERKTFGKWYADKKERAASDLAYAEKSLAEEVERAKSRTEWIRALRSSL
jgi:hypothetical protein